MLFREGSVFVAPAYPLETVVDPTGAGDSFAGGFMGYLTATGDLTDRGFRRAAALGSVMGSFAVEDFSTDCIEALTRDEIESRFREFTALLQIDPLSQEESLPWRD
jgi:sugar/nucleoside kinase (ribokinase family)